jgi:hypothetical protein
LAEGLRRIDLTQLRRTHPITPRSLVKISYVWAKDRHVEATVSFLDTPARFSGRRLWFRCPSCSRPCQVLYGSWHIACQRCHRLRYMSQRETRSGRANLGMMKIVKHLDPEVTCNELPPKPIMHWSTYDRLAERYDTYDTMWGMAVMRQFHLRLR